MLSEVTLTLSLWNMGSDFRIFFKLKIYMVFSKTFLFIAHSRNVKFYTLDSLVLHTSGAVYFKLFQMNLN